MDGVWIATIIVVMIISFVDYTMAADSRLSLQCKNIARDVVINSCKGPRVKRYANLVEAEKTEMTWNWLQPDVNEASNNQLNLRKRQVFYRQPRSVVQFRYGFGYPQEEYASQQGQETVLSLPGLSYMDSSFDSTVEENYGSPMFPMPYQPMGYIRSSRSGDLLGFNLSPEELEELHEEVSDRMPRNSKDLNKKIFQHIAAKCCPNARLCYDNPSLIPCMGY